MKFSLHTFSFTAGALLVLSISMLRAQGLDPATIAHPPSDSWPSYHGDYSGKRHSSLTQIAPDNVDKLGLAWMFQTGQNAALKCSPLLVNGVLYFSVPDNVWAVDARSGHQIWHYTYPPNKGSHIGNRGVAMYKDWLYFMSPDGHLVCLNAKDGTLKWNVVVADYRLGYWTSMSPLVIRDHVIVGVSGDFDNLRGYLRSIDPETGKTQWEWDATPPVGTPNTTTGGMTWMTGTYDPSLNLVYWGTGNPTPVLNGKPRPGDNLYTCSIVALNPDTGKLVWAFQPSPHDTHDWDAVETPVLVDADFHGTPRKMLMQTSRNGYFFVLDRTNGKSLLTVPYGPVNWAGGIDEKGRPIPNPEKEPAPDGRLIAPDEGGLTNYRSPSFDTKTGLFIVNAHPSYGIYFAKPADGVFGWAGADYGVWGKAVLDAIDYQTGKIRWSHELGQGGSGAGVVTTESGLTFTADAIGNVLALDTRGGKTLWHAGAGAMMQSSPITFELDGRQYLVTCSGSVVSAWALPHSVIEKATTSAARESQALARQP
jgi:alcohol dehydrogenase (cytochrome c)